MTGHEPSGFGPAFLLGALSFPFCRGGGSDLLSSAPPSPSPSWELQGPVPTASLATETPKPGLAQLEEPCPIRSPWDWSSGCSPGLGAPLVTQASWKRLERATRIPCHPTRSSRHCLCVPSPPHGCIWWPLPAVCSAPAPGGCPCLLLLLSPSRDPLLVLGEAPSSLPGLAPGPAKPNIFSSFISPWGRLLGLLLAFVPGLLPCGPSAGSCHAQLRGCLRVPGAPHSDLALTVPSTQPQGAQSHGPSSARPLGVTLS